MTQVIRYVIQNNKNESEVVESFLKFVRAYHKTGESLIEDILDSLSKDNVRISDYRGQSFDDGSNMSGKVKGLNMVSKYILQCQLLWLRVNEALAN